MQNETLKQENIAEAVHIYLHLQKIITMLEKTLERKARQSYLHPRQYPETYFDMQTTLLTLRRWIEIYRAFCQAETFHTLITLSLETITQLVIDFIITCRPAKGKKQKRKSRLVKEHESIANSIHGMLAHIHAYLAQLKSTKTAIGFEVEKALLKAFEYHCCQQHEKSTKISVSKRGQKTIIFLFSDKSYYPAFVRDNKTFRLQVVEKIQQLLVLLT